MSEFDDLIETLMEDEAFKAEYLHHVAVGLTFGRQGYGKGMRAKEKRMWEYYKSVPVTNSLDSGRLGTFSIKAEPPTKLPQKVCNYRKKPVYWYGTNNHAYFDYSVGYETVKRWAVFGDTVEGYKGKRFIGISEPTATDVVDQEFLKRFTGDEWVETKTYDKKSATWKPLGEVFVMSGKLPKINDRD